MSKVLMRGNEALGAAAIKAGCEYFFGYPITPQSEVPEYMSKEMPKHGGVFLQAESEVAAINMVYGAAGAGARVMTSSSSPGIALKQEGMSYLAGAELPAVIVNMMRGGPGLGSIQPSQTDYFQSTRGGGNGEYRMLVLAPSNVQELVDHMALAFEKAEEYRNPTMVVADGMVGQMMEPVDFSNIKPVPKRDNEDWATTGRAKERGKRNIVNSLYLQTEDLEEHNKHLEKKFAKIRENEVRVESFGLEDADIVLTGYGTAARIIKTAITALEEEGIKVGFIRPITIWPFPYEEYEKINPECKNILTVEMNQAGQMVEDVNFAIKGRDIESHFYGRSGGIIPTAEEIIEEAKKIHRGEK